MIFGINIDINKELRTIESIKMMLETKFLKVKINGTIK